MNEMQKTESDKAKKGLADIKSLIFDGTIYLLKQAIAAGKILNHMKDEVFPNDFGKWLAGETDYSRVTAHNWMTLAKNEKGVLEEATNISEALKLLEPPKKEEPKSVDKPKTEQEENPAAKNVNESVKAEKGKEKGEQDSGPETDSGPKEEAAEPEEPEEPKQLVTPAGQPVPEHLVRVFERTNEIKLHVKQVTGMMKEIHASVKTEDPLYQYLNSNMLEIAAKNMKTALKFAIPFAVCPACGADDSGDCMPCRGSGFLNKEKYDAVVEDLK